jgi:hypothetical protein
MTLNYALKKLSFFRVFRNNFSTKSETRFQLTNKTMNIKQLNDKSSIENC